MRLYEFGQQFNNIPCLSTKIQVGLARLDLCPLGHTDHTHVLNDLAFSFSFSYRQGGNISDLNKAIEILQARLNICPLGHPEHAGALGNLARCLFQYYFIQRNEADLTRLIQMQERWLDICPSGHPDHPTAIGELASSLYEHYHKTGDIRVLNRSIEMGEERLELCPSGHPQHGIALGNLAASMSACYHKEGNLIDLKRATDLKEIKLDLCPSGHWEHGLSLQNLAISLQDSYKKFKNPTELTRSIKLLKEALATYPPQYHVFSLSAGQLAKAILLPFKISDSHPSFPPLDQAFETYRLLKTCSPAVSLHLWDATQAWIQDAEEHNHSSVLEAYQTSLNALDHFTSFNPSLDSRHEKMQARTADLANNAFSCGVRHGDLVLAIELLEQGRGILWNQLARFDISADALGSQGRTLGDKFIRLSADLKKYAEGCGGVEPYWRVLEEWQSVVDKIRCQDGFSRFLLPPHFEDLQQAAEDGPVIIVNASESGCDAVIVLRTGLPIHIILPCSLTDVAQLCSQLSELTRDAHAYVNHRESYVKQLLRELWSSVVEPIVTVLQDDIQLPPGSRIWWCPTSKFTLLPLHAAGPHQKAQKNFMDIYVSSYAPSLSALIRTRERIHSQRTVLGTASVLSFAVVGQARPSTDTKLSELPEVEYELQRIRNETGMPADVTFEIVTGDAATIEDAVQAFREHRWVHVACHGAQHAKRPFESWFAMADGKLTLLRIIRERYTNSEFAFLSACHTAAGDVSTPDEVLHLAAGMQFAGFSGVIGTLWRVDDAVTHQVVTRFYKEMFKQPAIGFEHAAIALNAAVVATANEVSLEKRIVFVHIGI